MEGREWRELTPGAAESERLARRGHRSTVRGRQPPKSVGNPVGTACPIWYESAAVTEWAAKAHMADFIEAVLPSRTWC